MSQRYAPHDPKDTNRVICLPPQRQSMYCSARLRVPQFHVAKISKIINIASVQQICCPQHISTTQNIKNLFLFSLNSVDRFGVGLLTQRLVSVS
jgi:hypothetical protein